MKHLTLSAGIAALFLVSVPYAAAQKDNQFTLKADHLSRGEIREGGLTTSDHTDAGLANFVLGRTRLFFDYERPGLTASVSIQHGGTWGSNSFGSLSINEAWAKWSGKQGLFAKIGRQNLIYDDQRIFGNDDWAMTAISHDVVKTGYEHGHFKGHLFFAFNQNPENMTGGSYFSGGVQPYKGMEACWLHYDEPTTKLGASVLLMNITMQGGTKGVDETNYHQQLYGTYLTFRPDGFTAEASAYWQRGHEEHGIPVVAWMGSIKATAKPSDKWTLHAGYDYLSGDENFSLPPVGLLGMTRHETIRGFSSLYGSHHSFYGAMDFFYVSTYYGGFTPGLQNLYIGTKWSPSKKFDADASFHFLATAAKLRNADRALGHELELSLVYKIGKDAKLSAGYSYMYGTETMETLKRSTEKHHLHWGWVMLSVVPTLFTSKW